MEFGVKGRGLELMQEAQGKWEGGAWVSRDESRFRVGLGNITIKTNDTLRERRLPPATSVRPNIIFRL